jgi:SSS family solute:Na+ symporter
LSASSRHVIRRNAVVLPAYSFALGLIALLGYMAVAAGVKASPAYAAGFKTFGNNYAVPALFLKMFPSWFVGIAFAAIAIGALVPAAIMSIACANLFTRNIWREYVEPDCHPAREARVAKVASLVVGFGGLFFAIGLPVQYAIQLQLLGGVWIIQTLPSVLLGLYFRRFHPHALLVGWLTGITAGTAMAWTKAGIATTYALHVFGVAIPCYAALSSLILNVLVTCALSLIFNVVSNKLPADATAAEDYVS